ncbi:MAG: RNA-binding protein [Rhodobacteraceae bacterium]|nr:RNA-binding protein [Paracoccaceae bacterium]
MSRGGRHKQEDASERRCIVTSESSPKTGLVRFVVGPDGEIVPDILGKLPGRGMYVTASRAIIDKAGQGQFARSAKTKVQVRDDLSDEVERQLLRRVIELIALARKAGLAIAGFEKVKSSLINERVRVLMQASDGSARGKGKLRTPEGAKFFGILTSQELGLAFGRQSVIHGALASGGLSKRVVEDATKLRGLREDEAEKDGGQSASGKDKVAR